MHPGRPWAGSGRTQDWPGQGLWPSPVLFRQSDSLHGPQATKTAQWGDHTRGCWLQGGGSGRLPWALSHLKGSVSGIQRGPQSQRPCACHGCGWGRSPATPFPPGARGPAQPLAHCGLHAWFPTTVRRLVQAADRRGAALLGCGSWVCCPQQCPPGAGQWALCRPPQPG